MATPIAAPNLLWIPGLDCDADYFTDIRDQLPPDQRGLVVDISAAETLAEMVKIVDQAVEGPTCLVGASMGGWIAQAYAAAHPEAVSHLVLLTTWSRERPELVDYLTRALTLLDGPPPSQAVIREVTAQSFTPGQATDALIDRMMAMSARVGVELTRKQITALLAEMDVSDQLGKITAPTLIIGAVHDVLVSPEEQIFMAAALEGSHLIMLPSGHACVWERPAEIAASIERFLNEN